MTSRPRRRRVEPTDEWEQIELLCGWPEQRDYELIRPLVLFGAPADKRSQETGVSSGRTLRRRAARFDAEGMDSLFGSEAGRRRRLPPAMRRLIVDLKAEHPALNPNEIASATCVSVAARPARRSSASSRKSPSRLGSCAASRPTTRSPSAGTAGRPWSRCTPTDGARRPSPATSGSTRPPSTVPSRGGRRRDRRGSRTAAPAGPLGCARSR